MVSALIAVLAESVSRGSLNTIMLVPTVCKATCSEAASFGMLFAAVCNGLILTSKHVSEQRNDQIDE